MKFVMFLRDPIPKLPPAPHKEMSHFAMQLISHLSHPISEAPFLLIQALSSSREEACLCACPQSTRHANGVTKITVYKRVSKG